MGAWTCPECGRMFARQRQGHDCAPGLTLEEYFATGPAHERPVYEAVMSHLTALGPLHADIVAVGIFLKNPRKFADLRPMRDWVAVSFWLHRHATHPTITRKVNRYGGRFWHTANVRSSDDLDEALLDLLRESYESAVQ